MANEYLLRALRGAGVPDPDGTSVGDALHVLAVYHTRPDDMMVLAATSNVYGNGDVTGLSLGDLRELVSLANLGLALREKWGEDS